MPDLFNELIVSELMVGGLLLYISFLQRDLADLEKEPASSDAAPDPMEAFWGRFADRMAFWLAIAIFWRVAVVAIRANFGDYSEDWHSFWRWLRLLGSLPCAGLCVFALVGKGRHLRSERRSDEEQQKR